MMAKTVGWSLKLDQVVARVGSLSRMSASDLGQAPPVFTANTVSHAILVSNSRTNG